MTWVEIYALAFVATPIAATLIALAVCWRDSHKTDRSDDHRSKSSGLRL